MIRIKAILINLDRDKDRLTHMQSQLQKVGVSFTRFPAILGAAVPDALRPWFYDEAGKVVASLKPGEIGVYASHISLHQQLLRDQEADAYLIMEDDLELDDDFGRVIEALAVFEEPFDMMKLSNPPKAPYLKKAALCAGREAVVYSRVPNNLGAYVISRSGAQKTSVFRGLRRFAIDEDLRRPWDWQIETLGVLPPPARANIFEQSSIDSLGARALGQESFWDKLKRRRWESPVMLLRRGQWQIRCFGFWGWMKMLGESPRFRKKQKRNRG